MGEEYAYAIYCHSRFTRKIDHRKAMSNNTELRMLPITIPVLLLKINILYTNLLFLHDPILLCNNVINRHILSQCVSVNFNFSVRLQSLFLWILISKLCLFCTEWISFCVTILVFMDFPFYEAASGQLAQAYFELQSLFLWIFISTLEFSKTWA